MAVLNQIIAVTNGKKTKVAREVGDFYKKVQKPALFDGIIRTYKPDQEDGEQLPSERKNPQYTVDQAIADVTSSLASLFDVVATQDWANCTAKANIVVDEQTLLENVPVTHLLFLEKQLIDVQTFVASLPTLDPAEEWKFNNNAGYFVSDPSYSNRTQKKMRNHVLSEATQHHPAQVQTYTEDVKVGVWTIQKFSGALPMTRRTILMGRIGLLLDAVRCAREQANMSEVKQVNVSGPLFDYIFQS